MFVEVQLEFLFELPLKGLLAFQQVLQQQLLLKLHLLPQLLNQDFLVLKELLPLQEG